MSANRKMRTALGILALFTVNVEQAVAATVMVSNDDWTLSDTGFSDIPEIERLVVNRADQRSAPVHASSSNVGLAGASVSAAMAIASANYTTGTGFAFNVVNISADDAIRLDDPATYALQSPRINGAGGTSSGVAVAGVWSGFSTPAGGRAGPTGMSGSAPTSAVPIFDDAEPRDEASEDGLISAVAGCCESDDPDDADRAPTPVPLPASGLLILGTLCAVATASLRRNRSS